MVQSVCFCRGSKEVRDERKTVIMLLTANVGVALIENSSGREDETAGLRAAAPHIRQPSHLCHDGRVKV